MSDKSIKALNIPSLNTDNVGGTLFGCFTINARESAAETESNAPSSRKIKLGVICICLRGDGYFYLNCKEYKIHRGDMVIAFPNSVIQNIESTDDFLGYAIAMNTEFIDTIKARAIVQSYVKISETPVITLDEQQINTVIELCEMLKEKSRRIDHPFQKEITKALLSVLNYEIHAIYQAKMPVVNQPRSRRDIIFQDFLALVEKNYNTHRDIGFYANQLFITPKYLSVVVKSISGISPVDWINRIVLLNAKTMLSSSDLTVQQISAELNFPNPSFFGQYFKRIVGMTPKKYRAKTKI